MSEKYADLATVALLEFLNACEAGIAAAKHLISEAKSLEEWNPEAIKWEQAEGSSGPYERSEDANNPEFKSMLRDLASHGGKMTRNGYFFWVFKNGHTIGRKKRGKKEPKPSKISPENLFPERLRGLLSFEEVDDAVIIKPRQFLGAENFAKIADMVKHQGGEWVSAGKDSHFKMPLRSGSYGSTT